MANNEQDPINTLNIDSNSKYSFALKRCREIYNLFEKYLILKAKSILLLHRQPQDEIVLFNNSQLEGDNNWKLRAKQHLFDFFEHNVTFTAVNAPDEIKKNEQKFKHGVYTIVQSYKGFLEIKLTSVRFVYLVGTKRVAYRALDDLEKLCRKLISFLNPSIEVKSPLPLMSAIIQPNLTTLLTESSSLSSSISTQTLKTFSYQLDTKSLLHMALRNLYECQNQVNILLKEKVDSETELTDDDNFFKITHMPASLNETESDWAKKVERVLTEYENKNLVKLEYDLNEEFQSKWLNAIIDFGLFVSKKYQEQETKLKRFFTYDFLDHDKQLILYGSRRELDSFLKKVILPEIKRIKETGTIVSIASVPLVNTQFDSIKDSRKVSTHFQKVEASQEFGKNFNNQFKQNTNQQSLKTLNFGFKSYFKEYNCLLNFNGNYVDFKLFKINLFYLILFKNRNIFN